MLTLKIHWIRLERGETVDESTIFVQADSVQVSSIIDTPAEMQSWEDGSFFNYQVEIPGQDGNETTYMKARLVQVDRDNKPTSWYLCSMAWLLGENGKTLEKLI